MEKSLPIIPAKNYSPNVITIAALLIFTFCGLCFAQDESRQKAFINEYHGYRFELPEETTTKDSQNGGNRMEVYKEGKIAMIITVFEPNPIGSMATYGGIKKSDDVTMKERIVADLYQSCRPQISSKEFVDTIDWSSPIIGGEAGLQANGSTREECTNYPFPLAMVRKGRDAYRFTNVRLSKKAFEKTLSSFLFVTPEKPVAPVQGGE
jgi:hypothetical protein